MTPIQRGQNLSRVEPRTLKENVTKILRQSIIEGSLAPGTEFNQAQLAEKLGVSRGPIREAVGLLEQEGLIQSTPYKGIVVTSLTARSIEELYTVRASLETLAIRQSVRRVCADDINYLHSNVEQMERAAQRAALEQLAILDLKFHEYIVCMADNQLLHKLWKQLESSLHRCLHAAHTIYIKADSLMGMHPQIVDALADRDGERAIQILYRHITNGSERIVESCRLQESQECLD